MTTRWRPEFDPNYLYFITTKVVEYRHVFRRDIMKRIVADAMYTATILSGSRLYAFVIMPNHIHVLLQCPQTHPPGYWIKTLRSMSARLVIRHYQVERNEGTLDWLASQVKNPKKQRSKVWEDNYLAKSVVTRKFLLQKLKYIHENPVQERWQSARSWCGGRGGIRGRAPPTTRGAHA